MNWEQLQYYLTLRQTSTLIAELKLSINDSHPLRWNFVDNFLFFLFFQLYARFCINNEKVHIHDKRLTPDWRNIHRTSTLIHYTNETFSHCAVVGCMLISSLCPSFCPVEVADIVTWYLTQVISLGRGRWFNPPHVPDHVYVCIKTMPVLSQTMAKYCYTFWFYLFLFVLCVCLFMICMTITPVTCKLPWLCSWRRYMCYLPNPVCLGWSSLSRFKISHYLGIVL